MPTAPDPSAPAAPAPVVLSSLPDGGLPGADAVLWSGDAADLLRSLPRAPLFDLVLTSPPYNIGKPYEDRRPLDEYLAWQDGVIAEIVPRLAPGGSVCWQVGTHVDAGAVTPLDIEFHPMFRARGLRLRNRIVWHFGHGLHARRRFSGRHETVLWYTAGDDYVFDLDAVRVPAKYPGKKHFRGDKAGQYSGNPLGKNPSDVWDIPNVKARHMEKTGHPCQFPVGLAERLVLALTRPGGLVFDPFAGSGSAGVAALAHGRRFLGAEVAGEYVGIAERRLAEAMSGTARYRPHALPVFDHTLSKDSRRPAEWGARPAREC